MSTEWLQSRILWHNVDAIAGGIGLLLLSALLWAASFFVVRWFLLALGFLLLGADWTDISFWGGMALLVVLLIDGYWNRHLALDVQRYAADELGQPDAPSPSRSGDLVDQLVLGQVSEYADPSLMRSTPRGLWMVIYVLMNFFFAAPRTLLMGIAKSQGRITAEEPLVTRAARILSVLYQRRAWVDPARELPDQTAIGLLDQLGLIWTEEQEGRRMIRWPAGKSLEEV